AVADASHLHVAEAVGIEQLEKACGIRALDEQLAESRHVDDAEPSVDVERLVRRVLVRMRAAPEACPHHRRAGLLMPMMDGRPLGRLVAAARKQPERDRGPGWARRRRPDRLLVRLVLPSKEPDRGHVAEPPLAGAHRHGRIALAELDRVEAFGNRTLHVLFRYVLADADEATPRALGTVQGRRRHGRRLLLSGSRADGFDVRGKVEGDEDPALRVVLDPRPGLSEERVRRLAAARHHEQVALDLPAVDDDAPQPAAGAPRGELAWRRRPEIDALDDARPGSFELVRDGEPALVC